jgi:hypothetical protein
VPEPADDADAKIPTLSNGQPCQQCGQEPDGKEREHIIDGETVVLHPECKRFWLEGDGWGRR